MDQIDFMLSNRRQLTPFERRLEEANRREFDQVRRAELEAEAKQHRDKLLFDAMRIVGVEPGVHFNAAQAVTEAEAVRDEAQRALDAAQHGVLNRMRELADINVLMGEAERMRDKMVESENLVVPVSAKLQGASRGRRPFAAEVSRSAAPATCRECAALGATEDESAKICQHQEQDRAARRGSGRPYAEISR